MLPRPINEIQKEIVADWKNIYFGAVPYLNAMRHLNSIEDEFGLDPAREIINYLLANANAWRGEKARAIKAELKAMVKV